MSPTAQVLFTSLSCIQIVGAILLYLLVVHGMVLTIRRVGAGVARRMSRRGEGDERRPATVDPTMIGVKQGAPYLSTILIGVGISFVPGCREFSPIGALYSAYQVKTLCAHVAVGAPLLEQEFMAEAARVDIVAVRMPGPEQQLYARKCTWLLASEICDVRLKGDIVVSAVTYHHAP